MSDEQECRTCGHGWNWHGTITGCDHVRDSRQGEQVSLEEWLHPIAAYECGCKARRLKVTR